MNVLLVAVLFSALDHFAFLQIPTPQTAGASFTVTIYAEDASGQVWPYTGPAALTTTLGSYVMPSTISFNSGFFSGSEIVTLATDTIRLECTESRSGASGVSSPFTVMPGDPARYVTILPGETLAPGSANGRYLTPTVQTAGRQFVITSYITDNWFNLTPIVRNDSLKYSATDLFAIFPTNAHLQNSEVQCTVSLRTAGQQRIYTAGKGNSGIKADTSSWFSVVHGPFGRILVILPGEQLLPGDTTTQIFATPGKSGKPTAQFIKVAFPVRVVATDSAWNQVSPPSDSVQLASDFAMSTLPPAARLQDSLVFMTTFDSAGSNQTIWAVDYNMPTESYRSLVDIRSGVSAVRINFWPDTTRHDTINAGEIVTLRGIFSDANGQPITAKACRFRVISGHGRFPDSTGITDTAGMAFVQFQCDSAHFSEQDSVEFSAGGFAARKGIYIASLPEAVPPQNRIIAWPNPFGYEQDHATIAYYIDYDVDVTVAIYDPFGNPVMERKIRSGDEGARHGINEITWDGRDERGRQVASGIYLIEVSGTIHTGTAFKRGYRIGVVW